MTRDDLEKRLAELVEKYGEWTFDIPLPHGVWTSGNRGEPQTRLRRVMQIFQDLSIKPLAQSRVLDLGSLDGQYAIECALHGAKVVGVEAREANIAKAEFARDALGLTRLRFVQDDIRNVSLATYGSFDIVPCSGVLYHLEAPAAITLVERIAEMATRLAVIDTHVALAPQQSVAHKERHYAGIEVREHAETDDEDAKLRRLWYSYGNDVSFLMTRPSLINLLQFAGFSSVYECFNPPHLNFGRPGIEHADRCTFVAVKAAPVKLKTSPAADGLEEEWPEGSLTYTPPSR